MEAWSDPRTDGQLLVATVTDPEAFAVFFWRHVRGLLSFFRRRVPTAELAFDLTAETFAAALEASPGYELCPEPARGWLYGIAWNKLHEAQRRGQADDAVRRQLGMAPIALGDEGIARVEAAAGGRVLQLLDGLSADQRDAVRARLLDERPYQEIADELRCSPSVVRQRVSRPGCAGPRGAGPPGSRRCGPSPAVAARRSAPRSRSPRDGGWPATGQRRRIPGVGRCGWSWSCPTASPLKTIIWYRADGTVIRRINRGVG